MFLWAQSGENDAHFCAQCKIIVNLMDAVILEKKDAKGFQSLSNDLVDH